MPWWAVLAVGLSVLAVVVCLMCCIGRPWFSNTGTTRVTYTFRRCYYRRKADGNNGEMELVCSPQAQRSTSSLASEMTDLQQDMKRLQDDIKAIVEDLKTKGRDYWADRQSQLKEVQESVRDKEKDMVNVMKAQMKTLQLYLRAMKEAMERVHDNNNNNNNENSASVTAQSSPGGQSTPAGTSPESEGSSIADGNNGAETVVVENEEMSYGM